MCVFFSVLAVQLLQEMRSEVSEPLPRAALTTSAGPLGDRSGSDSSSGALLWCFKTCNQNLPLGCCLARAFLGMSQQYQHHPESDGGKLFPFWALRTSKWMGGRVEGGWTERISMIPSHAMPGTATLLSFVQGRSHSSKVRPKTCNAYSSTRKGWFSWTEQCPSGRINVTF